MQILQYTGYVFKRNRGIFIFTLIFVAAIQFFIIQIMSTMDLEPMRKMMNSFPPAIKALMGKELLNRLTVEGTAAFAFTHPITYGILSYLAISIPNKEITKSIESGEMEIMLSYPISRKKVLSSVWITGGFMLAIVSIVASISSIIALYLFHDTNMDVIKKMFQIGHNLFTIFFFAFSFSMVIAVFSKDASKSTTIAVGITGSCYLVMILAQIWDKIDWTKRFNFFNYFDPNQIINNQGNYLWQVLDLSVLILIMFFISSKVFQKRDI